MVDQQDFATALLPKSPEQRKEYIGVLKEAAKLEAVIESAKLSLKDIRERVKDEYDISSKNFNKALSMYIDDTLAHEVYAEAEEMLHVSDMLHNLDQ